MDQERENSLNPHPINTHVVGSGLSKHEELMSKLRQPIQSVPLETFLKVRDALKECDDYLNQVKYENGDPIYLNNIGAGSILHNRMFLALESTKQYTDENSNDQ